MGALIITHTQPDGTLLDGSTKGDGVLEIVKAHGFRWFPSIGAIGIRGSRDHVAREHTINAAAAALRAAGHDVTVTIDNTPRDRGDVLADQAERLDDRYAALTAKAQRRAGEAAAAYNRADEIAGRFEGGQPIILGHHSTRKALRDRERMSAAMQRGVAAQRAAETTAVRAEAVGSAAAYSERPGVTARRIARQESDLRIVLRDLEGYTRRHLDGHGRVFMVDTHAPAEDEHRRRLLDRQADLEARLEYDRKLLDDAITDGRHVVHSKETLHVGDQVTWGLGWYEISKVNRTTVKVHRDNDRARGGFNLPMLDIRKVLCPHGEAGPVVIAPTPTMTPLTRTRPVLEQPDPARVAAVRAAASAPVVHAPGYFPTSAALAEQIVREHTSLAGGGPVSVLEPSAGHGSLVRAVHASNPDAYVVAVEPVAELARLIGEDDFARLAVFRTTFEEFTAPDRPTFDLVLMNPPFSLPGQPVVWAEHVHRAYSMVRPGGRLVAIVPAGFEYRREAVVQQLRDLVVRHGWRKGLPDGSFVNAGTEVAACVIWVDKPSDPKV
jgi:Domain of unknown function (DUF3560)